MKNIIIGIEKKLTNLLKELKASESISENDYKKLKPKGSSFGVLYGLCKTNGEKCPPFRLILSAIKTPYYNLAKFLVPLIEPITKNNFTVKNSFEFSKEICEQNSEYFMASLDTESLTPIYHWRKLLKYVVTHSIRIKNCCLTSIKTRSRNLYELHFATTIFFLMVSVCQRVGRVAMGSSLDPSLANTS